MGNTNDPPAAAKPPENTQPSRSMSLGSSMVTNNTDKHVKGFHNVPIEMQDAILELLETCKE
jgi:hypothetical protein